jgi:hypothetical protein
MLSGIFQSHSAFFRRISGLLAFLAAAIWPSAWHYIKEFCRAALYDRALHVLTEYINYVMQYGVSVALVAFGLWLFWMTGRRSTRRSLILNRRLDASVADAPSIATTQKLEINVATMSNYDRDRRRREIDELIASITVGETLQSLKDAGALAHLLQSAIYTGHSVAEFKEELIKVQNALVAPGNERLQIANRYPEHHDILNLIERKDQIVADADSDPHDLGIWPPVHSYLANPNIPNEALTPPNVATWIFFKDTKVIRELNARLFGYCDWCEKVKAALVEKRRALDQ